MCHLKTYYRWKAAKKKQSIALLQLFRWHAIRIDLTSKSKATEVKNGQNNASFWKIVFFFANYF